MITNILYVIYILYLGSIVTSVDEFDPEITAVKFDNNEMPSSAELHRRVRRQAAADDNCQFDVSNIEGVSKCTLIIHADKLNLSPWRLGVANNFNWLGGPPVDASDSADGGYAFADMSDLSEVDGRTSAWMLTTPRQSTGAAGRCLKFKYAIKGLRAKRLSVLLVSYFVDNVTSVDLDSTAELPEGSENVTIEDRSILFEQSELFHVAETTKDKWIDGKASFSSSSTHSIAFVATLDPRYAHNRGYIAVDNIAFTSGSCDNDCTFDKDLCTWKNSETGDEFDWSLGRSSTKRGTGPARDQLSSASRSLNSGGYIFIDSSFPRRSGDKARLESADITALESPLCLSFWAHMYGGGIGSLKVMKQVGTEEPIILWQKGPEINSDERWIYSQLTVSAPSGTQYKVLIEAEVGETGSGDIAVDTITFSDGACPQLPPRTSTGPSKGDCTFSVGNCEWKLNQPETLTTTFTPMLSKISGSSIHPPGRTQVPFIHVDYYMSFEMGNYKHRVRDSAYLISPTIQNTGEDICLSFWVFMFTTEPTMVKIGSLTVMVVTSTANTTIWKLENKQQSRWEYAQVTITETSPFQIYIQGTKGTKRRGYIGIDDISFFPSTCELQPPESYVTPYDCSFDAGPCNWKVETLESVIPSASTQGKWKYADFGAPITVLEDHTFGGKEKSGFMYVEAINADVVSLLVSQSLEEEGDLCLGFFFAAYYTDNAAELNISSRNAQGDIVTLWKITQADLPRRPEGDEEVQWDYGQVAIKAPTQAVIQGKVRTGGWAIDDITFTNGTCSTRPPKAIVTAATTPAAAAPPPPEADT